jgi:hypothetical protein
LLAAQVLAAAAQALLHSLTPQAVVVVVVATVQTSAGIVTLDTLDVTVAADLLVRTIVLLLELAVVEVLELLVKELTELAVILVHQQPIKLDQAVVVDLVVNKEFQENHGVTDKVTVTTAAVATVVVVADLVQAMAAALEAKAQ